MLTVSWASKLGYFQDNFIEHFLVHPEKIKKKGPIIHKGYYTRVSAIRNLIQQFIQCGGSQFVILGAGFDTHYFTLKSSNVLQSFKYFELDFPKVVKQKAQFIGRSKECQALIGDSWTELNGDFSSNDYHLISIDLRNVEELQAKLKTHGVDANVPTLFLSECVLIYVNSTDTSKLIKWSSEFFQSSMFVIYEMILPFDGFGKMMVHNLNERGVSLSSYHAYPDLPAQKKRMLDLGYAQVDALDMNKIYSSLLDKDEVKKISRIEFFDEYEEWVLIQQHYCIVLACQDKTEPGKNIFASVTLNRNK